LQFNIGISLLLLNSPACSLNIFNKLYSEKYEYSAVVRGYKQKLIAN